MPSEAQVARFLGLEDKASSSDFHLVARIRDGIPHRAFKRLTASLDVSDKDLARIVAIPTRTLARRGTGSQAEKRFKPDESDRLARVARIVVAAIETLGSEEKARAWLRTPNRALGNVRPLDLLDTDVGAEIVSDSLIRIEHGIFG